MGRRARTLERTAPLGMPYAPRLGALRPTGRRRGALAGRVSAGGVSAASTSSVSTSSSEATAATPCATVTGALRRGGGLFRPPREGGRGRRPPPAERFFGLPSSSRSTDLSSPNGASGRG